jgi:hypothetical protein
VKDFPITEGWVKKKSPLTCLAGKEMSHLFFQRAVIARSPPYTVYRVTNE